ncbi:MAG: hypothetical protein SH821_11520 [Phototrophicales bacterium]|nr:hypothetical protein [Phototrophicales bacterium]
MQGINHIIVRDTVAYIMGHDYLKAEMVARIVVDGDHPIASVMEHYELTYAEVHSALAYYYDNQAVLDEAHHKKLADIHASATTLSQFKEKLANKK